MAISRMQEPQQIQSGIGSLQDPRQGYFLGKLVKKATRGIKKVFKSPIGKLALLAGGAYGLGALGSAGKGGFLKQLMAGRSNFGLPNIMSGAGKLFMGSDGGVFGGGGGLLGVGGKFDPKRAFLTAGAAATALPFLMGGGEDEEEEVVDVMDPRYQVQRAKNYYSGAGDAGAGLDFMPQKKYVMQNFYAANGGRAGYSSGNTVMGDIAMSEPSETFKGMGTNIMNILKSLPPSLLEIFMNMKDSDKSDILEKLQLPENLADGGRAGYANGMMVEEDDEEEFIRSGAGQSFITIFHIHKYF